MESLFNLFDRMPNRNVVSWTVLMDACLRWEQPSMALVIFREMQETGVKPDQFAIVSLLSACARLGTLNLGMWVHAFIERVRLEQTIFIGTALVDMYCKCGSVDNALAVFNSMPTKTLLSWNAMLHGLSVNGRGREAVELFSELEKESGIHPNEVTFVAILCGCSHSGLVKEGRFYFGLMQNKYGIEPTVKHYGCMVDLLGRAGLLEEAFEMVNKMPVPPNTVIWGALLSACRVQNNMGMAERVSQKIIGIDEDGLKGDTSHYVIMSNMYARAGLMDKMAEARLRIGKKPKGRSWIEIGFQVHEFSVGDSSHPMWARTKEMLDEVMEKVGENRGEENPQTHHSEKVAVAFGLLNTCASTPIRIVKNLRMCADCHRLMKSISKVYKREIVVRDSTRFHRFMEGGCSCKDYW
ncbi:PREDICTED: pentatricopeptide repeat-containing protein At4g21065-like [Nelumbo nucifera]|nr:PREDICTED: pentatricopeptide repeat-containing protein At4g21065-like [Nelumbo nucifera]